VWHVKQNNDGTSFLGFEETFQSAKLLDQNHVFVEKGKKVKPISLIYSEQKDFQKQLNQRTKILKEVIDLSQNGVMSNELINLNLGYIQNDIVSDLEDFIVECYLNFLVHVLSNNNPDSINLKPINTDIKLDQISDSCQEFGGGHWLTIQQIIGNIWNKFKFLPFKEKFKRIRDCIDFKYDETKILEISKHIAIRNCIQHHQWELVPDVLRISGMDKIKIENEQGKYNIIKKWEKIELTAEEVSNIIDILLDFVTEYAKHVKKRIKSRMFLHNFEFSGEENKEV